MKLTKIFTLIFLISVLTLQPALTLAQTSTGGQTTGTGGTGGSGAGTGTGGTATGSNSGTTSQYNANVTSGNGKSFSGTSFSGVGGAVAGCANVGGRLVGAVSGLFSKKDSGGSFDPTGDDDYRDDGGSKNNKTGQGTSGGDQSVPVNDSGVKTQVEDSVKKVEEENKQTNRTLNCLNGIAYAAAKSMLQQLTNKTLNWVNTGLGGNPLYSVDVVSNLRTIRDQQLENYIGKASGSDPIFGNFLRSTVTKNVTGISDGYINKGMNTPEYRQYAAFQSDFTQGGWGAMLNMNYNPIGAVFKSTDNLIKKIDTEQTARTNEIQRNNGFLDMRECVEYEKVENNDTDKEQFLYTTYPDNEPRYCSEDYQTQANEDLSYCNGKSCRDDVHKKYNDLSKNCPSIPSVSVGAATISVSNEKAQCLKWRTTTPGSVIASQTNTTLGSSFRQLELADSINELLGAYFDKLVNNLFQKGLASFQNGGKSGSSMFSLVGGMGSNVVLGTNGLPISGSGGSTANMLGYVSAGNGSTDVSDFDISRPQQLRVIIKAQYDFLNVSRDSQIALRSIVPRLGALDYCIPGPNPTWRDSLDDNWYTFLSALETPSKERTFAGQFLSAATSSTIQAIVGLFGGGGNEKDLPYILIGQATLFDKVDNVQETVSPWNYEQRTDDYSRGIKQGISGDSIRAWMTVGFNAIKRTYDQTFTDANIIKLFTDADPTNVADATVKIKNSLKETANLITYNQTLPSLDSDYSKVISEKSDEIRELEDIRLAANSIVKTAKARYIAQRAASGNPVDMSCIDQAYVIDETPIIGRARQESDVPDPMIGQSRDASKYFYTGL